MSELKRTDAKLCFLCVLKIDFYFIDSKLGVSRCLLFYMIVTVVVSCPFKVLIQFISQIEPGLLILKFS